MERAGARIVGIILFVLVALPICAQVNVTTYHNDNARTGQNTQESVLTPSNVKLGQFGKLFSVAVDGQVYAQPLVLSNVSIDGGTHNVVYVATENDSVYAIDANSGTVYWRVSLGTPEPEGSLPSSGCNNITPQYGITSTPVIDPTTGTLYVVAENGASYQLHALAVGTGLDSKPDATIGGSDAGVTFNALSEMIRPGLLLDNGHIIIAAGSYCDHGPWYGWVFSYSASTLLQEAIYNTQPNGGSAGIWMSGNGVAADGSGNLYFATGNGDESFHPSAGNSIFKLSPPTPSGFSVVDSFSPSASDLQGNEDNDVGSGGVLLIPGTSYLVGMGKEGVLYLVNTTTGYMGEYCGYTGCPDRIVQEIQGKDVGVWGSPAYWNGYLYYGSANENGATGPVEAFSYNANGSGQLSTSPTSVSPEAFSWPTPTPSVSANGNTNGIVWALDNSGSGCCQVLHAYNANNLSSELYNSNQCGFSQHDQLGGPVKFSVPAVANGKVYAGGSSNLSVFGLLTSPDFCLTAVPSGQTVNYNYNWQYQPQATFTITTTALAGFTGTVSLSSNCSSYGWRCTFSPSSISGSGSSTMSVYSEFGASYMITIDGLSGSLFHIASVSLDIL